jgi:hypothetical protein
MEMAHLGMGRKPADQEDRLANLAQLSVAEQETLALKLLSRR